MPGPAAWIWPAGSLTTRSAARPLGDVDHVEAQLFGGSSRLVGLGMGEPGRVGPIVIAKAKHDDFGGGIIIGFWNRFLGHDILRNLKGGRRPPWVQGSLTAATLRPSLSRWRQRAVSRLQLCYL